MPAKERQTDAAPGTTGQAPPAPPATGLEEILPGRPPLPHAEEKGAFFVYQRELAPGTRLEQYEVLSVLGSGGFGITYLAKDLFLNRNVVIKENFPASCSYRDPLTGHIRPNNEHDLENYTWALKSFLSEAQTLAEPNHPGIVRILSVFEANGTAYFAMEHITGLSLDYLGEKLHTTGHRYTEDELKGLLTRLLRILEYLHASHIYHRDIKPGNILLTEEGTPVLIDFGAARHALKLHTGTGGSAAGGRRDAAPAQQSAADAPVFPPVPAFPGQGAGPADQLPLPGRPGVDQRHLLHFRGGILRHHPADPRGDQQRPAGAPPGRCKKFR